MAIVAEEYGKNEGPARATSSVYVHIQMLEIMCRKRRRSGECTNASSPVQALARLAWILPVRSMLALFLDRLERFVASLGSLPPNVLLKAFDT